MALAFSSPESSFSGSPQPDTELAAMQQLHPPQEGVFNELTSPLYRPVNGTLTEDRIKPLRGGEVKIGTYQTKRASHRVGIYTPDGYDPKQKLPQVLMTTPLGTGARGHNQRVAEEMMRAGFRVLNKAVPRYPGLTRALSLTDDVNEMFGFLEAAQANEAVEPTDEIFVYGESQAAMKALGVLALADSYGKEVVDALVVAPCYLMRANLLRLDKQIGRMKDMAQGCGRFVLHTTHEEREQLRGTFNLKDLHHHIAVIPVLISGETGSFLPHIPEDQKFTTELYGQDGHSHPRQVKADLDQKFPNVTTRVLNQYGHVDGIMSQETAALRRTMLFELASQRKDG